MQKSLTRLAKVELDFLLKRATLPQISGPVPTTPKKELDISGALAQLKKIAWSPRSSNTPPASKLFQENHHLYSVPEANALLLRDYIKWHDFSTAHAFILQSIDRLRVKDVLYFMMKSFSSSENSKHLVSVFAAASKQFPEDRAQLAAFALVGLKLLQETSKYNDVRALCHKWGLERSVPVQQVQLFNYYLEGKFDQALELSRTIKSREPHDIMFPYRWATLYAARNGEVRIFSNITKHLKEIDQRPTKSMSNVILGYFPALYPDISLSEWLVEWGKHGWPITITSVQIMVDHLARRLPEIGGEIWKMSDQLSESLTGANSGPRNRPIPLLRGRHSPFFQTLRSSLYYEHNLTKSMQVLESLNRNGIVPSYDYYVHLFQALVKSGSIQELETVKAQMQATKYPLHCAGIDLAVLERQLQELHAQGGDTGQGASDEQQRKQLSHLLVREYLVQYPLSVHDVLHLTRIAFLHKHYLQDPESAEHVLEFRRMCTPNHCYNASNHDKKSLTLLLEVGSFKPDEWLIQLLKDEPAILFDFEFRRMLSLALKKHKMQDLRKPLLEKVRQHNSRLKKTALEQVQAMYDSIIVQSQVDRSASSEA